MALKKNGEGYFDPTAGDGMKELVKEESEVEAKCNSLVKVIKLVAKEYGFEIINRIEFKHIDSGRMFR